MGKDKYADKATGKASGGSSKDPFATRADAAAPEAPVVATEAAVAVAAPEEGEKPKARVKSDREHIASYLSSVTSKSRHPNLPQELLERMGKSRSKNEAKRLLKGHLQRVTTETSNGQTGS